MDDKKKKLAAIAGVMNFLKTGQEQVYAAETFIPTLPTFWASYGRTQTMANNQLMQRRVMKR